MYIIAIIKINICTPTYHTIGNIILTASWTSHVFLVRERVSVIQCLKAFNSILMSLPFSSDGLVIQCLLESRWIHTSTPRLDTSLTPPWHLLDTSLTPSQHVQRIYPPDTIAIRRRLDTLTPKTWFSLSRQVFIIKPASAFFLTDSSMWLTRKKTMGKA